MKRFIWNFYTALYIHRECDIGFFDGCKCALESTEMFEHGLSPQEVAEVEREVRQIEREVERGKN